MLVAIVLSVAAMFAWMTFGPKRPAPTKEAQPPAVAPATTPGAAPAPGAAPPGTPAAGAPAAPVPAGPAPRQDAPRREWTKTFSKGEFLDVRLTTRGGAIAALRLRNSYEESKRDATNRQPIDVLLPVDADILTGGVCLAVGADGQAVANEADPEGMRTRDWTEVPSADDRVTFAFLTTNGWRITKTFVFPSEAQHFDVDVSIAVEKVEGVPAKDETALLRLVGAAGLAREPSSHTSIDEASQMLVYVSHAQDDPVAHSAGFDPISLDPFEATSRAFRFAGIHSPYFFASVWAEGGKTSPLVRRVWGVGGERPGDVLTRSLKDLETFFRDVRGRAPAEDAVLNDRLKEVVSNFQRAWVEFEAPVGPTGTPGAAATFHLYAGPLSRGVFGQDRYATLSPAITYSMAPDWLARLLLSIFDLFRGLTGSAGFAVILMTLAVRGGLMPLSIKNQLSMRRHGRKVSKLKPKLEALKARFAADPRRFREEQVKLYKEQGIGFPMGCVMMLLQIPIFFALFAALRIEFDLRHQVFAWIRDLSGPDRLVDFGLAKGLSLLSIPPGGGIRGLNLLPLLYMGLAIYQQRLMPKPSDEQQAQQMKMAKWMAIIFPVLLYNYTAALALYMCCSSIIAIIESRIVRTKDAHDIAKG